jgi:hypothetical protein
LTIYPIIKFSSEKQNVKSSPDRADILPQSRRAREIKAKAGLILIVRKIGAPKKIVCVHKKNVK